MRVDINKEERDFTMQMAERSQDFQKDPALAVVSEGYRRMEQFEEEAKNKNYNAEHVKEMRDRMGALIKGAYQQEIKKQREQTAAEYEKRIDKYYEQKARTAAKDELRQRDLDRQYQAMRMDDRNKLAQRWIRGEKSLSPMEVQTLYKHVSEDQADLMQVYMKDYTEPYLNEDPEIQKLKDKKTYYEDIPEGHFRVIAGDKGGYMHFPLNDYFGE